MKDAEKGWSNEAMAMVTNSVLNSIDTILDCVLSFYNFTLVEDQTANEEDGEQIQRSQLDLIKSLCKDIFLDEGTTSFLKEGVETIYKDEVAEINEAQKILREWTLDEWQVDCKFQ
jgi:hypothetical protein